MRESTMTIESLAKLCPESRTLGDVATVVSEVEHDSRRVRPGALYVCFVGDQADGHDYAEQAVAAGATGLLVSRQLPLSVPQIIVEDTRKVVGVVSAAVHGDPSQDLIVIGVTGTNGKTTVTHLLSHVMAVNGTPTEVIGTLSGARTTPEAPELQRQLARYLRDGIRCVVMEVSSHALELGRVCGTRFALSIFTNLSAEHLDFHPTMEAYFTAKARLFEPALSMRGLVNLDDPRGRLLRDAAIIDISGYQLADAEVLSETADGSEFVWRGAPIRIDLVGRFNISNAVAAATAASKLDLAPADIARALTTVRPVPGRFEPVRCGQPFGVFVDYSHTPDALEQALLVARNLVSAGSRVHVVFGCGGDRDPSKRPLMGRVAAELADRAILTSDNPRSEDIHAIIDDVRGGDPHGRLLVEPDRARAIRVAIEGAGEADVVIIAGKGHETTQIIGEEVFDFDDRIVASTVLGDLGYVSGSNAPVERQPFANKVPDEGLNKGPADGADEGCSS